MNRKSSHLRRLSAILFAVVLSASAWAADLNVSNAWVRVLPGGAPAGGYFVLRNDGKQSVVLVGASSAAFGHVMMHRTADEDGISRMLPADRVEVPAGGKVGFEPGGYHLMLMQPNRKMAAGERIPVTLEFAGGQKLTTEFQIGGPTGK